MKETGRGRGIEGGISAGCHKRGNGSSEMHGDPNTGSLTGRDLDFRA